MSLKQFTFEQQQHEIKAAADRERRRIRRAQAKFIGTLRTFNGWSSPGRVIGLASAIERATSAKRSKNK